MTIAEAFDIKKSVLANPDRPLPLPLPDTIQDLVRFWTLKNHKSMIKI